MNKTIIINISGVIFHIEEDAYEILKNYINEIKAHFASFKDNYEIITDIEDRIAEMFSELLAKESKQVIVQEDVSLVISKMGTPSDFGDEAADDFQQPENNGYETIKRKLFRDTDDRILGGVCSGSAHYFGIEPVWFRVLFAVLFFVFGTGLFAYILLWLIIPKAKTRTDKMEMRGEKINLQAFQKNVEDELNAVAQNISKAHQHAKPSFNRIGGFIRDLVDGLGQFLKGTGKLILKIAGFFIIAIVGISLISAFIGLLIFLGYAGNADVSTIFPLNALAESLRPPVFIAAFLVILIPLLGIILLTIRVLFKSTAITKSVSFSLFMTWIVALAVGIFCIAKNATDFKEEASFSETIQLKSNEQKVYYLQLREERTIEENYIGKDGETKVITISGNDSDFNTPNNININLKLIENGDLGMIKTYTASGRKLNDALNNAKNIDYYYGQKDSLLIFDENSGLKESSLWRGQKVGIKLNIPLGSVLYIQKKFAWRFLRDEMYDCLDNLNDNDEYIKVTATTEGFSCAKTASAIERQKEYNRENGIEDPVKETILF
jgi:phage shock protein PspC (stress-responsive transcriptional regulator)